MSCFFFNDTPTTEIYTLSLHDPLPISTASGSWLHETMNDQDREAMMSSTDIVSRQADRWLTPGEVDRKSTRLNSSHANISYAVFCLKKQILKQKLISNLKSSTS